MKILKWGAIRMILVACKDQKIVRGKRSQMHTLMQKHRQQELNSQICVTIEARYTRATSRRIKQSVEIPSRGLVGYKVVPQLDLILRIPTCSGNICKLPNKTLRHLLWFGSR
jgi:hypothetical protein